MSQRALKNPKPWSKILKKSKNDVVEQKNDIGGGKNSKFDKKSKK